MAIHSKGSLPTTNSTRFVTSAEGTIQFNTNVGPINTHALQFPFPVSYGTPETPEGSSFIVDETTPAGFDDSQVNGLYEGFQATDITGIDEVAIWAGEGKVKFFDKTSATDDDFNTVVKELSQIKLPILIADYNIELQQGAFAFASSAATGSSAEATGTADTYQLGAKAADVLIDGTVANTAGDVVRGGQGKAVLTGAGNFEKVVNLTTIGYPFTLATGESIRPIGSSVVFVTTA